MSRADKRARRIAEHATWVAEHGRITATVEPREDWEMLGWAAARPPDAPDKRPVACQGCSWQGHRHEFYYYHPKGQRTETERVESGTVKNPCPRCGGTVAWST